MKPFLASSKPSSSIPITLAQFRLGMALGDLGRSEDALEHFSEALRLQPDNVSFLWQTAWILATSPDSSVRDGARAVELARKAVELSQRQELHALDALAAALAETGQFAAAVDVAWQASISAIAQNQVGLSDALAERIRLYRQGRPFRQPPAAADRHDSQSGTAAPDAAK